MVVKPQYTDPDMHRSHQMSVEYLMISKYDNGLQTKLVLLQNYTFLYHKVQINAHNQNKTGFMVIGKMLCPLNI